LSNPRLTGFQNCPVLGVGIGLRSALLEDTLAATDLIDWLEITPENYMQRGGRARRMLTRAHASYPLVSHGVNLSLGSIDPFDVAYLHDLKALFDWVQPAWFSDHLTLSSVDGLYFNELIPLPRNAETVRHVVRRIQFIQDYFQRPFLIENASFYLDDPDATLNEADFLTAILERSDCGLLLDVNNVFVNATNHRRDPLDFLSSIPLERVVQIHVAGHTRYPEGIVDTHGDAVCADVWALLDWTLQRCRPCGVMLERDIHIPPFAELRPELETIRHYWNQSQKADIQQEKVLCPA